MRLRYFGLFLLLWLSTASATPRELWVLLDIGNTPQSGCSVATAEGIFSGAEQRLSVRIEQASEGPQVVAVERQLCAGSEFGAAEALTTAPYAIGVGEAAYAGDVVEARLPRTAQLAGPLRLGFASRAGEQGDALLQDDLVVVVGSAIPLLSSPLMPLLAALLLAAWIGLRGGTMRRHGLLLTLLLVAGWGLVQAALTDWEGVAPLAEDELADAPAGLDLMAVYLHPEMGQALTFRFDLNLDEAAPTLEIASPAAGSILGDGRPSILLQYADDRAGVEHSSLALTANGAPLEVTCSDGDSSARCTPLTPLASGAVTLGATLSDRLGKTTSAGPITLTVDTLPPQLAITAPGEGALLDSASPTLQLSFSDLGAGVDPDSLQVVAEGGAEPFICTLASDSANCLPATPLTEGSHHITATLRDRAGHPATAAVTIQVDTLAPTLTITSHQSGETLAEAAITLAGEVSEPVTLTLNGDPVGVDESGHFSAPLTLSEGGNLLQLSATDAVGHTTTLNLELILDTLPPTYLHAERVAAGLLQAGQVPVTGSAGAATPAAAITLRNLRSGAQVTTTVEPNGSFFLLPAAEVDDQLSLVASGPGGVSGPVVLTVVDLPPDPAVVGPAIDPTVHTTLDDSTRFLYSGENPIQIGVVAGTIEPARAAVIRGRVVDRTGTPVAGLRVSLLDHPEYGYTRSRLDGEFDLAVNGGGYLVVAIEGQPWLPLQRKVKVAWQQFTLLDEVVVIEADSQATPIDLSLPGPQLATASRVADSDGERQATLFLPSGTQASLTEADGTTTPLTQFTLRMTEYTVGERGPAAMPAQLPPTSAYTYAVEMGVDEAGVADAELHFDRPVAFYVENFLGFATGAVVPVGWYDRTRAVWVPADNGRVITLLAVDGGRAQLDLDGSGSVASATALAALGISDEEQIAIASRFAVGGSFWRVTMEHFSPWDCNWPYGPPGDAQAPPSPDQEEDEEEFCEVQGSIIECENQNLGERVPLTGTGLALNYRSNRAGRTRLTFPVSSEQVPETLARIEVEVWIAGKSVTQTLPAQPDQSFTYDWDGLDVYGRKTQGTQWAQVKVGYVYAAQYYETRDFEQAFASVGSGVTGVRARQEIILWKQSELPLGRFDAAGLGLGGWTVDGYDFAGGGKIWQGNGQVRTASNLGTIIETIGGGSIGLEDKLPVTGRPARETAFRNPQGIAVAPDGTLYVADIYYDRISRITPDGMAYPVAGHTYLVDGTTPMKTKLTNPTQMVMADEGSLYFVENWSRVWRLTPAGELVLVAGGGTLTGAQLEGAEATAAKLDRYIYGIALSPGGELYISAAGIYRVDPNGHIWSVSKDSALWFSGKIAFTPAGELLIANIGKSDLLKLKIDGHLETLAGIAGSAGFSGDGRPATDAQLAGPYAVAPGPQGELYIADTSNGRIRVVRPDGTIRTLAGNGQLGYSGDGGPPTVAQLYYPYDVTTGYNNEIYIADGGHGSIRRIRSIWPNRALGEASYLSSAGQHMIHMDAAGRHSETVDARTGKAIRTFEHDAAGRLTAIQDPYGNRVTLQRDPAGQVSAIMGPDGQTTRLEINGEGVLTALRHPDGSQHQMQYHSQGRLTDFTNPRGDTSHFSYAEDGRLVQDAGANGSRWDSTRTEIPGGHRIDMVTAEGQSKSYSIVEDGFGNKIRTTIYSAGHSHERVRTPEGHLSAVLPDGTSIQASQTGDPRFGWEVPRLESVTLTTPSGRATHLSITKNDSLQNESDPLSLAVEEVTVTRNGKSQVRRYDAANSTLTLTSAAGREQKIVLDDFGQTVQIQTVGIAPKSNVYDDRGRLISVIQGEGASARHYGITYDEYGYVKTVIDPLGRATSMQRDTMGRVTLETLPGGRSIKYEYNSMGQITAISPPGRTAHRFSYEVGDQPLSAYDPPDVSTSSDITHYRYNRDKQLTRLLRPSGETVDLSYDLSGHLRQVDFSGGYVKYEYAPAASTLAAVSTSTGERIDYLWDGFLLTEERIQGTVEGNVRRHYNSDFLLDELRLGEWSVSYEYDHDGLLTQVGDLHIDRYPDNGWISGTTLQNVITESEHNEFGDIVHERVLFANQPLYIADYVRDGAGRIVEVAEMIEGQTYRVRYDYDVAGRLSAVERDGNATTTYRYDMNGNLEQVNGVGVALYDSQDRQLQYNDTMFEYTANGELYQQIAGAAITHYAYDSFNNLKQVVLPTGTAIDYLVDGQNRRIGKQVDGQLVQRWIYSGQLSPLAEVDGAGEIVAYFVYGEQVNVPSYVIKNNTAYRVITNHLGSPVLIINSATGAVVQRIHYDEWGRPTFANQMEWTLWGFAGGLYDSDTGLVRFGVRDYNPVVGRWLSKDPVGFSGGSNYYVYANNDPVNELDIDGLRPLSDCEKQLLKDFFPGFDLDRIDITQNDYEFPSFFGEDVKATTAGSSWQVFLREYVNLQTGEGIAVLGHEILHNKQSFDEGQVGFLSNYLNEYNANLAKGMSESDSYENISYEQAAYKLQNEIADKIGGGLCCQK